MNNTLEVGIIAWQSAEEGGAVLNQKLINMFAKKKGFQKGGEPSLFPPRPTGHDNQKFTTY